MNPSQDTSAPKKPMPVLFLGHGSPMNALLDNPWSQGFATLGKSLPRPKAILAISAHWHVPGVFLTGNPRPPTVHDFGNFPPALFQVQYPAPGEPALASRLQKKLSPFGAETREDWGLDHGTWSVLVWMFPQADIPVLQLSLHAGFSAEQHLRLGQALQELREEGILILGSGNIVHNLGDAFRQMRSDRQHTPDWAARFDQKIADALQTRQTEQILTLWKDSPDGRMSHPTPEHYLPLLYCYGAAREDDPVSFPIQGFDWGSLSMRAVCFG